MSKMRAALQHINKWLFEPAGPEPLSFLRIATALVGLLILVTLSGNFMQVYGSEGFVEWVISNEFFRISYLPSLIEPVAFLAEYGVSESVCLHGTITVYAIVLFCLLLGWHTRIMAMTAWILHLALNNTSIMFGYGVETFLHIGLFYSMIAPSAGKWSLDARAGRVIGRTPNDAAGFWIRVIQLHLCIVYLNAGLAKSLGIDWWNGDAIWRATMQPSFQQFNLEWLAWVPVLSIVGGWATLLIETVYPVAMYIRRLRRPWLVATIGMHLGIALFMGLWLFSTMMIVMNIAGFWWPHRTLPQPEASLSTDAEGVMSPAL